MLMYARFHIIIYHAEFRFVEFVLNILRDVKNRDNEYILLQVKI